jgi:drug/metabolite transporter (DMT)-like permease
MSNKIGILGLLVLLELFTLALMKNNTNYLIIMGLYAIIGAGLNFLIQKYGLLHINATFDILGIIGSSIIAVFWFKESIKSIHIVGLFIGLIALYLLQL